MGGLQSQQDYVIERSVRAERAKGALLCAYWKEMDAQAIKDESDRVVRTSEVSAAEMEGLNRAIDGCKHSAWHMGRNDAGTTYNDLDLIFRSADKVDKFISMGAESRE